MSYPQYSPPQTPQQTQPQTLQSGEPPLWAPYYGAPFPAAVKRFFAKYSTFSGRASRSEYWWWALVSCVVYMVIGFLTLVLGASGSTVGSDGTRVPGPGATIMLVLILVWYVAVLVPSLALTVRRLHDINFSGWMLLLGLVPFVGPIILLVFTVLESKPEGHRFDQPGK